MTNEQIASELETYAEVTRFGDDRTVWEEAARRLRAMPEEQSLYPDGFLVEVREQEDDPWCLEYARKDGPVICRTEVWVEKLHSQWSDFHAHRPAMPPAWPPGVSIYSYMTWLSDSRVTAVSTRYRIGDEWSPDVTVVACMSHAEFQRELER